jgi:hypothetical protein
VKKLAKTTQKTTARITLRRAIGVGIVAVPAAAAFALVQLTSSPAAHEREVGQRPTPAASVARPRAEKPKLDPLAPIGAQKPAIEAPRAASAKTSATPVAPAATATSPLARLLSGLRAADESNDEDTRRRLHDELVAFASENPARAAVELVAALRAAKDESETDTILGILTNEVEIASRPEVAAAFADIALNDTQAFRRSAAVRGLGEIPGADESRLSMIAKVARADRDEDVRQSAAFALGEVSEKSPGRLAAAASRELVSSLSSEPSGSVRTGLIYSVRDTRDPAVVTGLMSTLSADGEIAARQAAADVLGDVAAAHRVRAVETLASRFDVESDRDMRLTILTSIIRAGRENAVKALEALKPRAGELAADVDDYLEGLKSGETDMDKLFSMKQEREQARGVPAIEAHEEHDHD